MTYMFIMLMWIGGTKGGPAVIHGFTDLRACEDARVYIENEWKEMSHPNMQTRCVQLAR